MEALALSLLVWLSANSGYDATRAGVPPIRLLSPEAMTALYYQQASGGGDGVPAGAPKIVSRIQGYFSWSELPRGAIYLVRPEDTPGAAGFADPTANPLFRERLLHELVHFAQHTSGAYARCVCPRPRLPSLTTVRRYSRRSEIATRSGGKRFRLPSPRFGRFSVRLSDSTRPWRHAGSVRNSVRLGASIQPIGDRR